VRYYADLHIHSKYSRATSSQLDLEHLWRWAQIKGLTVVATGDCVHPGWLAEIKQKLAPCGDGFFELKPEHSRAVASGIPPSCAGPVRFILSTEISSIYKRDGKVRKVHNVVYLPDLACAEKLAARLGDIGNVRSDGRPILGLDSRDLLDIVLSCSPDAFLVPAHIWTPWFSVLGSKSGFDTIEECFGDLTTHIYALETGLSSDPPMNWRLSSLDKFILVSNSDAHSPNKLGREANIFETDLTYAAMLRALRDPDDQGLAGTVEFFPEEGKYHYDGHRKCETRLHPRETIKNKGLCPVCGKPVTVGVMARVEELATRPEGEKGARWRPYHSMVPLVEIIGECLGAGPASQKVEAQYNRLVRNIGNEFTVLLDATLDRIEETEGELVAEGIRRVRHGEISVKAGYDGEYGTIEIFSDKERTMKKWQTSLFEDVAVPASTATDQERPAVAAGHSKKKAVFEDRAVYQPADIPREKQRPEPPDAELNEAQKAAVRHSGSHLLIIAGPGTGKTHTLICRIAQAIPLCTNNEKILAITFTNKAAEEMRERISARVGPAVVRAVDAGTFHQFCLGLLRAYFAQACLPENFSIATDSQRDAAALKTFPSMPAQARKELLETVSKSKNTPGPSALSPDVESYNRALHAEGLLDFDDILCKAARLLAGNDDIARTVRSTYRQVFVDEYQDINGVQHELLKLLVQDGVTLTAIGDPNQAIYGFRGSDVRFFELFTQSFPGAATMVLSENYRSAPNLLKASGNLIAAGSPLGAAPLLARFIGEGRLTIHEAATEKAEAEYVVHEIEKLVGGTSMFSHDSGRVDSSDSGGRTFGDCAVLYRTNAQSRPIALALERSGIPYQVSGEKPLSEYPLVKEAMAFLLNSRGGPGEPQDTEAGAALERFSQTPNITELLEEDRQARDILDRLVRIATLCNGVQSFIDYILLQHSEDPADFHAERVSLLTLHASKGLEFPVVFITGCENGLVPLAREGKNFDLAEERRLFYVGMTRAKERLYLTRARRRTMYGKTTETRPSPFLADIKEELKTYEKAAAKKARKVAESEQTDFLGKLF
jgi:DNA helicase-2/ATP-dependent DNA helicase PcrA